VAAEWLAQQGVAHQQWLPAHYRDVVLSRYGEGRLGIIGDAAHAMSPQLGQGVNMALLDARCLRDALRSASSTHEALAAYEHARRDHVGIYHFWSRWLTPLFQSERDGVAAARDILFHPMSRIPGGRGQMLRILTGTRRGWLRRYPLQHAFLAALGPALVKRDGTPAPCVEAGVA
jgi:2-polyprenyl-6-methoxyphenol hydroxylase-like FAD-dependent oxidoreductase